MPWIGEAQAQDLEALPARNVEHLQTRYDTILSKATAGNPPRPRRPGTRGRVKQAPANNLITPRYFTLAVSASIRSASNCPWPG